ncbi:MAG: AI-2E family transporter [Ignavibacteriales bacterium]|nr:AI-2E family transporter [Ignavibacteriales bacterium]
MKKEIQSNAVTDPPLPEHRPSTDKKIRVMRFEVSSKTMIQLILVVACLWLLIQLWPVFLVLVVALLIVGTMSPSVSWMEARRVKHTLGIVIVFTLFFVVVILALILTIPSLLVQASALIDQEPVFRAQLSDYLARSNLTAPIAGWLRDIKYEAISSAISTTVLAISMRIFEITAYGISAIFLALYIMIDRDRLRGWLFAVVPRSHHIRLARVMMNLETIVGAYIRGQLITCLSIAIFSFVLLVLCGVPNALALAVFAGIADILPYIGAILSIAPMVVAALARGPVVVTVILLIMLAYEEFESRVLVPRIYGRALRLPSSIVLFALLAGGTVMGILGALLALPIAATIMMLIEELRIELPGKQERVADVDQRVGDERAEKEYLRRTVGVPVEQAAAIAASISDDRREEESHPPEAVRTTIESGNTNGPERSTALTEKKVEKQ